LGQHRVETKRGGKHQKTKKKTKKKKKKQKNCVVPHKKTPKNPTHTPFTKVWGRKKKKHTTKTRTQRGVTHK